MSSGRDLYNELNTPTQGARIIPGLRERILWGVNLFMRLLDMYYKENVPPRITLKGVEADNPLYSKPFQTTVIGFHYYDELINAGIYALSLVKGKVKSYESMQEWHLPFYYSSNIPEPGPVTFNLEAWNKYKDLGNPITVEAHFKHQRTLSVTLHAIHDVNVPMKDIAWMFIYSLALNGVYVNAGHHLSSLNQILSLLGLFHRRMKDTWYQEAGSNLEKNVSKAERNMANKFGRFSSYGVNRAFYHHFRMLNYSKEVKARLRRMTGVGTDIIDYINTIRGGSDPFNEKERIKASLKRKLAFWKNTTIVEDYLNYISQNINNEANLAQANATFLGVVNMRMPAVEYKIVLPGVFWFYLHEHKILADFSAQKAYQGYNKLRQIMASKNLNYWKDETPENYTYAMILSIFDLHQADQNIVANMFDKFPAKTRADLAPTLKLKTTGQSVKLPELKLWSKMYNGERGGEGDEQSSVVQVHAGQTQYSGDDFIITKPEEVKFMEVQTGGLQIIQKLQAELRLQYTKRHNKIVTYGTQKWYHVADLEKSNEELEGVEGVTLTSSKVIPFYTSTKPTSGGTSQVPYVPNKRFKKGED